MGHARYDRPATHGPVPMDEWSLWVWGWHAFFWSLTALASAWLLVNPDLSEQRRLLGLVTVGLLMAAYALLVQSRTWRVDRRTTVYLAVAVVVIGVACHLDTTLSLLLFLVYPQAWMLTPTLRQGAIVTTGFAISSLIGIESRYGFSAETLRETAPQLAASLLFSMMMGFWISRIIEQSVERAGLIAELEAARSELNQAEHARGVMAERERIAREIHDTLAQGFTSIIMLSQAAAAGLAKRPERAAERLATIEEVARQNLAEARALVAAFAPVDLDGSTLPDAVRRLTERFGSETGLVVELDVAHDVTGLSRDREVVLLRAVQESLTNVRRHAAARRVSVRLLVDGEGARVEIGDDGVGFRSDETEKGYGLAGMRGRVAEVGGAMDVASVPGGGHG